MFCLSASGEFTICCSNHFCPVKKSITVTIFHPSPPTSHPSYHLPPLPTHLPSLLPPSTPPHPSPLLLTTFCVNLINFVDIFGTSSSATFPTPSLTWCLCTSVSRICSCLPPDPVWCGLGVFLGSFLTG